MDEILSRMQAYPQKLYGSLAIGMGASLAALWEAVPPYPPEPDASTYTRTGTLGRTLGSDIGGGASSSEPEIFTIRKLGQGVEGKFGTRLDYAPQVIGDGTQASIHRGRWWTFITIAQKAQAKITVIWNGVAEAMVRFLEGMG